MDNPSAKLADGFFRHNKLKRVGQGEFSGSHEGLVSNPVEVQWVIVEDMADCAGLLSIGKIEELWEA